VKPGALLATARGWAASRRGSRHERGYGSAWVQLRARVLAREPLCRICRAAGRAVIAATVDHIVPKHLGGTDDESNLQPLCWPCHRAKTAREGRRARVVTPD
jgi:5-methylcytosine-specific restriction protein A